MNITLVILITILAQLILGSVIGVSVFLFYIIRRSKNNIDIEIWEVVKDNIVRKDYIGRKAKLKDGSDVFVCAGIGPKSVKKTITGKILDSDLYLSVKRGRYKLPLAYKDEIYIPIRLVNKDKSFNATPMVRQAIETAVAVKMDARETYAEKNVKLARFMFGASITLCFVAVLGTIVLTAILISVGPDFAGDIAKNLAQAQAVVPNIPG